MHCPYCDAATRVLESRAAEGGRAVRRRRECTACGERITTFERFAVERLWVRKRDDRRQAFSPEKLTGALIRAAHKREVSAPQLQGIVTAVEGEATASGGVIAAVRIGEICLERLRDLDRGAYLQFAGTLPGFNPEFGRSPEAGSVRAPRETG